MNAIRPAAVAGTFYPADPEALRALIASMLDSGDSIDEVPPKAIVVPHAGYRYSGALAATAYKRIAPLNGTVERVVLLGPCHRVAVRGLAAPSADAFTTPLGPVDVDHKTIERLLALPQVAVFDETHTEEHSLEVHLPFLQSVLGQFQLVPLVVGEVSADEIAGALDAVWGGPETLIVISSDLSHYLDYDSARALDRRTCAAIEALDGEAIGRDQACGRYPLRGLLQLARERCMRVETVGLCNSGDTAGPRDRVVGYGAWAFYEGSGQPNDAADDPTAAMLRRFGATLLSLAGASIAHGLEHGRPLPVDPKSFDPAIAVPGGCFVTLKRDGRLRGCIGSPTAHQPLVADVTQNAFRAAFNDPRFPPLSADEHGDVVFSISVLSPQTPMSFTDEADFLDQLRPHIDGVVIEDAGRRALFLPSVWEQLPDADTFIGHLKQKAGLKAGHWSPEFHAWRFGAHEIGPGRIPDRMA